jgi:hypothetical protein
MERVAKMGSNKYLNESGTDKVSDARANLNAGFNLVEDDIDFNKDAHDAHVAGTAEKHDTANITDSSNWNVTNSADAHNAAKAAIDAIEAGDSNAAIGVYQDVAGGSVNAYTFTYTDLTLFNELMLLCRFDTPNTGASTINVNAIGAKTIQILDENGTRQDLTGGELNGWVHLVYDLSNTVFIALLDTPTSSAEDSETASIIDLDTSVIAAGITKLEIEGVTTVNLLEDDVAGCESTSGWSNSAGISNTTDSSNELEGTDCIKLTLSDSVGGRYINYSIFDLIDNTKYYLLSAYVKNGNLSGSGMKIELNTDDEDVSSSYVDSDTYTRVGVIIQPTNIDTATIIKIRIYADGSSTEYGFVDAINLYEITAAEYALGADAVMAKYPYHRGLKGTLDRRIKCEGKNLFDKNAAGVMNEKYINSSGGLSNSTNGRQTSEKIPITAGETYTKSVDGVDETLHRYRYLDIYENVLSYGQSASSTAPANATHIQFTSAIDNNAQLELGNTATDYEPYKASQANLPRILHSVPDGTKDKWDVKSGVVTQNVSDVYTLQSGDIDSVANGSNLQRATIGLDAFDGIKTQVLGAISGDMAITYLVGETDDPDTTGDENKWYTTGSNLHILAALGTWADVAAARTALTSTVVTQMVFKLATQITHEYPANAMNAYKSGRIIQEGAVTFFAKPATGVITIPNSTDETYYIGTIESVQEQQDDGSFVDYEVSTNDDTTITLVAGYDDTKIYKVVYFPVFNTTLGDITYSYPMNEAKAISNNAENTGNTSKALQELNSFTVAWLLDHETRIYDLENP